MEGKHDGTVNYVKFAEYALVAAKQKEELQDRSRQQQEAAYLGLPMNQNTKLTTIDDK